MYSAESKREQFFYEGQIAQPHHMFCFSQYRHCMFRLMTLINKLIRSNQVTTAQYAIGTLKLFTQLVEVKAIE